MKMRGRWTRVPNTRLRRGKKKKEDKALQAAPGCSPWHQLGAVQGPETFLTAKPFP